MYNPNDSNPGPLNLCEYRYLDRVVFDRQPQGHPPDPRRSRASAAFSSGIQ